MGLFLVWCHRLICIVLSLCKNSCNEVCDVKPGIDPYPLLARSFNRWWPDFVTFTACKKLRFGLKRGKKAQCVSNRCKDLFARKKYFAVGCSLRICSKTILRPTSSSKYNKHKTRQRSYLHNPLTCTGVTQACMSLNDILHHVSPLFSQITRFGVGSGIEVFLKEENRSSTGRYCRCD